MMLSGNYQRINTSSKDETVQATDDFRPDLVLVDIRLDDENSGIEAAAIIRERFRIPFIYLTAYSDAHTLQQAKATEPSGFFTKPFTSKGCLPKPGQNEVSGSHLITTRSGDFPCDIITP